MRISVLLCLISVVGFFAGGCAQLRYSGRYQEVKIGSEPTGATVLVEGEIGPLSPVAVKTEDGTTLAYHSPMRLTTPTVLILDKESTEYRLKISLEGYPEFEKTLSTRFAFHPYLVVLFPIVPLWSDYEVRRFDDVFVNFGEYVLELEANRLSNARKKFEEAEAAFQENSDELKKIRAQLEKKKQELETNKKETPKLNEELKKAEEALAVAEKKDAQKAKAYCEDVSGRLTDARKAYGELRNTVLDLYKQCTKLRNKRSAAKKVLDDARREYEKLLSEEKAKQAEAAEGESGETKPGGN